MRTDVATTAEIDALLAANAPVAFGASGGKDSCALAFAGQAHLDAIGHKGPRILMHADLGRIEWADSLPVCERLAAATGLELVTVRREKGDMVDRWLQRWSDNVARYAALKCVQVILPWSTPAMRFCTSELKIDPICMALSKRFAGSAIVSASGIRADESSQRAKAPVSKAQEKLTSVKNRTRGYDWSPILRWSEADVWASLAANDFARHEAYSVYGSSRVSCSMCIMSTQADLMAATECEANRDVYRELVGLEIASTFGFKGSSWLGDVAPHLLSAATLAAVAGAKARAADRVEAEKAIPRHLMYTMGWPTCVPTWDEAALLAAVRFRASRAVGIEVDYLRPAEIIGRYEVLYAEKRAKDRVKARELAGRAA